MKRTSKYKSYDIITMGDIMGCTLETKEISKKDFLKLKEDDLFFVTNPGRMGDIDGSTFVIEKDGNFIKYRVGGWCLNNKSDKDISYGEFLDQFPKWEEALKKYFVDDKYSEKYIYVDMGFGNSLCVDKRIYEEFYPYLLEKVKEQDLYDDRREDYNPCLNYSSWEPALEAMIAKKNKE
ncbi:MAG: hypothetical protein IJI22_03390 [Bacilli bacterium]|nr:hypothetical protein [Bacilli bacterium]